MEVFCKTYSPQTVRSLDELAGSLDLFGTGGSDCHGLGNENDREPGDIPLPDPVREAGCIVPRPAPVG